VLRRLLCGHGIASVPTVTIHVGKRKRLVGSCLSALKYFSTEAHVRVSTRRNGFVALITSFKSLVLSLVRRDPTLETGFIIDRNPNLYICRLISQPSMYASSFKSQLLTIILVMLLCFHGYCFLSFLSVCLSFFLSFLFLRT